MFVSIADSLVAKGRRAGLSEGLGRAVLWLLEHRFSSVPRSIRRRVAASVDEHELRRWLERAVTAASVAEVFDDDE